MARIERLLWAAGLLCAAWVVFVLVQARMYRNQSLRIDRAIAATNMDEVEIGRRTDEPVARGVIARLEIPALALTVPVAADFDSESLRKGAGHIRGTAMPGGLGTVGIAGHRDTFFRPLRRISPMMDIRLIDETGTYHYVVDSTEVVAPDRVEVLEITTRPELTLITCFPFDYVGAAPKRFIVHAHLLSASPDAASSRH